MMISFQNTFWRWSFYGIYAPLLAQVKKSGQAQPLFQQLHKNHATLLFQLQGTIGKPVFCFDS